MSENSIRSGRVYYVYGIDLKLKLLRERPRLCLQDIEERILLIIEHACTCLLGRTLANFVFYRSIDLEVT